MKQRTASVHATGLLMILTALVLGCGNSDLEVQTQSPAEINASTKPLIATTNAALKSLAKGIVGDYAEVDQMQIEAESGQGLNVDEVLRLQNADLVFTNGPGANDAAWLDLISLDPARVHGTTNDEFELTDFIQIEDYREVHSHGDEGEHSHPWLVPQSWLNPRLAKAQSLSILNRLVKNFPDQESEFRKRYRGLETQLIELEELAAEVANLLDAKKVRVIASDPRLLFFTRALKLEDDYVLWFDFPETDAAIAELKKRLPVENAQAKTLLLWAQDAGSLNDAVVEATGIKSAVINLIEDSHYDSDAGNDVTYVDQLRKNLETVKAALEEMND